MYILEKHTDLKITDLVSSKESRKIKSKLKDVESGCDTGRELREGSAYLVFECAQLGRKAGVDSHPT